MKSGRLTPSMGQPEHCQRCGVAFTTLSGNVRGCPAHGIVQSREDYTRARIKGIRHHCAQLRALVPVVSFELAMSLSVVIEVSLAESDRMEQELSNA